MRVYKFESNKRWCQRKVVGGSATTHSSLLHLSESQCGIHVLRFRMPTARTRCSAGAVGCHPGHSGHVVESPKPRPRLGKVYRRGSQREHSGNCCTSAAFCAASGLRTQRHWCHWNCRAGAPRLSGPTRACPRTPPLLSTFCVGPRVCLRYMQ